MDAATLQTLGELISKGGSIPLFIITYFAWMSYRTLTRMEMMLELALRDRGVSPPKSTVRVPFVRKKLS